MTTNIPAYKTKPARKPVVLLKSKELDKAMERVAKVSQDSGAKEERAQREARLAIGETINDWLGWKSEQDSKLTSEFLLQVVMLATPGNRNKIIKHAMMPPEVIEQAKEIIAKAKQEEDEAKQQALAAMTETTAPSKPAKSDEAPRSI